MMSKQSFRFRRWSRPAIAGLVAVATAGAAYAAITLFGGSGEEVTANNHAVADASIWETKSSYSVPREITVYRSPNCGCCGGWIAHAKQHGFQVTDIKTDDMEAIKQKYNLPSELASCHTTIVDGYVMEGHIPLDDIKRFLTQKPDYAGLAVPGMPIGTPGMESGDMKQPFAVVAFTDEGEVEVFKEYQSY